jgi:hypothetical protein
MNAVMALVLKVGTLFVKVSLDGLPKAELLEGQSSWLCANDAKAFD